MIGRRSEDGSSDGLEGTTRRPFVEPRVSDPNEMLRPSQGAPMMAILSGSGSPGLDPGSIFAPDGVGADG